MFFFYINFDYIGRRVVKCIILTQNITLLKTYLIIIINVIYLYTMKTEHIDYMDLKIQIRSPEVGADH
jgi:hypothetical protein